MNKLPVEYHSDYFVCLKSYKWHMMLCCSCIYSLLWNYSSLNSCFIVSYLSRFGKQEAWVQGVRSPRTLSDFLWHPSSGWLCWCAAHPGPPRFLCHCPHPPLTLFRHPPRCCYSLHPLFHRCILFLQRQGLWLQLLFL